MLNLALKLLITGLLILLTTAALSNPKQITLAETADSYYQRNNWVKAAESYQIITASQAQNHLAWYRYAVALIELNDASTALRALENAANSPRLPRTNIFYQQARAYKLLNNHEAMFASLQQAADSGYSLIVNFQNNVIWNDVKGEAQFTSISKQVDKNARPCVYDKKHAQFDFWLGHWDVYGNPEKTGPMFGRNVIEKTQNGCLITEQWTGTGGSTGTSMNYFDGTVDRWVQHWVSASGTTINYTGEVHNGSMILSGKIFYINTEQNPIRDFRGTWTPLKEGIIRQFLEESVDGGITWYVWFEGYYFPDTAN